MNKQFNRQRRHNNNRSRSIAVQQITRFTVLDSSGPLGKLRGTALQLAEKYQAGAKDAQTQGDDVLLQTCQQYADHYLRVQSIAIENEQARIKPEPEEQPISETSVESQENSEPVLETPVPEAPVEKHSVRHSKKTSSDDLSMPMDALQEKSE